MLKERDLFRTFARKGQVKKFVLGILSNMDSNTPSSFMNLLDGEDSPQSWPNNETLTPSTNRRSQCYPPPVTDPYNMQHTAYPPPSFHHFPYHPYRQPPPYPMNFSGGSSQNPPNLHPAYYPPPNNEAHNVPPTEYPHYPYYPPPPTNSNYLSAGSNSTPSSTPTGSMGVLGNSGADVETIPDEGDAEAVIVGVVGGAKKWSIEEDTWLIRAWINIGTDAVVGSDQKKSSFWKRVASHFNEHGPRGASVRSSKTLNGRWSRCAPLVSKWTGVIEELERSNHSGWNDSMIVEHAQRLFVERIGKKFEYDHWYHLLKDQPKWRALCNPSATVGSGSSKRSHSEAEDVDTETVGPTEPTQDGSQRPEGRKAAKRRLKEKANNSSIIDVVTKQMSAMSSGSGVVQNAFLKFFGENSEDKSHKKMIREEMLKLEQNRYKLEEDKLKLEEASLKLEEDKLKLEEDRIMMMDTSMMAPEQAAYIQMRRAEILKKRLREASST